MKKINRLPENKTGLQENTSSRKHMILIPEFMSESSVITHMVIQMLIQITKIINQKNLLYMY